MQFDWPSEFRACTKKNNAMFIDYSEYCFEKVLDQLRILAMHCKEDGVPPPVPYIQKQYSDKFKKKSIADESSCFHHFLFSP